MAPGHRKRIVVVGADGSEGSRQALRLAAQEAELRGAALHALHAWQIPLILALPEPSIAGFAVVSADDLDRVAQLSEEQGVRILDEALAELAGSGIEIEREVVEANPAEALVRASSGAELLVVGSRGRGGFSSLLLGSVSQHCLEHAHCPVAVVPHGSRMRKAS
jgi:nucleotide-binding universal stress UspA family protein